MAVGVVGFESISVRKERDNMRKGEVLRRRNGREVKGEMVICMLWWYRCRFRYILFH